VFGPDKQINIPTEIMRTAIAVADFGDRKRAATLLSISGQRVSAHLKALDKIAGGSVFESSSSDGKLVLTSRGKVVIAPKVSGIK
jgi:DNA-binding transcriptional LysR family regulator